MALRILKNRLEINSGLYPLTNENISLNLFIFW